MIGRSRRAVSLAVAAALLAPPRLFGGEPAAAGLPVVLFLSDLPSDEAWLAGLDEALNGPPGAAAPLVVHRAVPDGGERLLAALVDSYRPAAVVSRRPLPDAATRAAESRGLRVLVFPPERDAAAAARELPRAPGGGSAAAAQLEFGDDRAAERALERLLAESPGDSEALGSLAALRR
ncbi:MAG: hypothetical protein NDJ72_04675, partial [Elusimicrobia bacterium]|nr:hypothetical protein [Elusimicrobiota bacterium]